MEPIEREYPFLDKLLNGKDVILVTDHGESEYYKEIRINVKEISKKNIMNRILPSWLIEGMYMYFLGIMKKDVIYVTFGTFESTYILMFMQMIFGKIIKRKVHIMFDCLWEPRKGLIGELIILIRKYLVNSVVDMCIVYGKKDIDSFNKIFGIDKEKLYFLPYHHTLDNFNFEIDEGDYIFSGGTDGRDYDLLLTICNELSLPLKIATLNAEIIKKAKQFKKSEVKSVSPEVFRDWMAKCRIVVIPWGNSIIRTGGHQTMVNAMLMEKPLFCYNEDIADGYIENNKTGITIPYGDTINFKEKLLLLYNSSEERKRLGKAGKKWVIDNKLNQKEWVKKIYDLSAKCYYNRSN